MVKPVRKNVRRAFTLFEMAIVALVIGIIAMIAMPLATGLASGPRVETAANQLLADLEYCQSLNMVRSDQQTLICFNQSANRYWLESLPNGSTTATMLEFPGDGLAYGNDFSTGRNRHLSGVVLGSLPTDLKYKLTFNRYGQPMVITSTTVSSATINGSMGNAASANAIAGAASAAAGGAGNSSSAGQAASLAAGSATQKQVTNDLEIPLIGGGRTIYVVVEWDTGEVSIRK